MTLEINALTISRGGRRIVGPVSFAVRRGQVAILRGPNGVGKSTLLRCLAGFIPPVSGTARICGCDIASETADAQDHLHLTGHLDAIKPQLSVRENLRFWAEVYGGDIDQAILAFALGPLAERPAHACSAGQKRRLGLARLMFGQRDLWLMDEPTVSLDQEATAQVAGVIRRHAASGGSVVVATHIDLGLKEAEIITLAPPDTRIHVPAADDPFMTDGFL